MSKFSMGAIADGVRRIIGGDSEEDYRRYLAHRVAYRQTLSDNYILTTEMDHPMWLLERQIGIGSSESAGVIGYSDYGKTPLSVFQAKIRPPVDLQDTANERLRKKLRAGQLMESVIAFLFQEHPQIVEKGITTLNDNKIRFHPEMPLASANLDRVLSSNEVEGPGLYEIKNVGSMAFRKWEEGTIPTDYWCQVQHQLFVTGFQWAYFGVFIDGWDLRVYEIEPDPQYHDNVMWPAYEEFLSRLWQWIENGKVELPKTVRGDEVARRYPSQNPERFVKLSAEMARKYRKQDTLKAKIKELKGELDAIKDEFRLLMGDAEIAVYQDRVIASFKEQRSAPYFDMARFKEECPELYSQYSEPRTNRILRFKDIKKEGGK